MNIWKPYLYSAVGTCFCGSALLWGIIALMSKSAAAFDLLLYLGILSLSSMFVISAIIIFVLTMKNKAIKLCATTSLKLIIITSSTGGIIYLLINICIMQLKGVLLEFLTSSGVIFPVVVGVIYGGVFGFLLVRTRPKCCVPVREEY